MNSHKKLSIGTTIALGVMAVPTMVAHADEGVVMNQFSLKDSEGKIVKEFHPNEIVKIENETEKSYKTTINNQSYEVDKTNVLKTIKHVEESLSLIQENANLKTSPDIFGNTLLELNNEEVIHRIDGIAEENGFVKVRTAQSVEGWVLKSALKQNIRNIPVDTSAFIDEDSEKDNSLFYGDAVTITGFENNQFITEVDGKKVFINKEAISFTEPPKKFQSPIHESNPRITSLPGWRTDPVYGDRRHHGGVDIAVPQNTPIYATADGTVIGTHTGETYNNGAGYGNYVKLLHAEEITSIYAHLTSLVVRNGETVKQGQLIGYSGSTGKSTGNHLHFQMEQNGILLDTSFIIQADRNVLEPAPK